MIIIAQLFFSLVVSAEGNHLNWQSEFRRHSGDVSINHHHLEFSPTNDIFWPYSQESGQGYLLYVGTDRLMNPVFEFNYSEFMVGYFKKLSDSMAVKILVGHGQFTSDQGQITKESDAVYDLEFKKVFSEKWQGRVNVGRHYAVGSFEVRSPELVDVLSQQLEVDITYQPKERQKWQYRGHFYSLKNDDQYRNSDLQWMYGLFTTEKWLWMGFGAQYLSHSESNNIYYWSPSYFKALGPRLEGSWPLADRWKALLAANSYWLQEEDFDSGSGWYLRGSLQWGGREEKNVKLSYESISSQQGDSGWGSDSWSIDLHWPL